MLLFLAYPWLHAGSHDLLLYQHRARCTLGASCLPFISTEYTSATVCVCELAGHEGRSYFLGGWLSASRLCVLWMCLHEYVSLFMCVSVSWLSRGIRSQASLSRDSGGLSLQRGTKARYASLPANGGNPVYMAGSALAGLLANTRAWCSHRLPPPMQV